jgi:subtilisin family serine protease
MSKQCLRFIVTLLLSTSSYPAAGQSDRYVILSGNAPAAEQALSSLGGKKLKDFQHLGGFAAELPPGQAKKLQEQLGSSVHVIKDISFQSPEIKEVFRPAGKPGGGGGGTGGGQTTPWGITAINAPPSWATTRGEDCYVCTIDTGINRTHPDLAANIVTGTNYINGGNWEDDNGHGTHEAGTIAALDNSIGVVGVAPQSKLLVAKALDRRGSGEISDTADAILGCTYMRNQLDPLHQKGLVINMSFNLGLGADFAAAEAIMRPAIQAAQSDGAILVGSAGNLSNSSTLLPPARYPEVLAALAMTPDGQRASFSSGAFREVDKTHSYIAPGVNVNSTWRNGGYKVLDGTSMAAPHLSGVAALMLSAHSQGIIATDLGLDPDYQGLGLPNAYLTVLDQAMLNLASSSAVPEPATLTLLTLALLPLVTLRGRR